MLTFLGIALFSVVPSYADRKYNRLSNANLEPISTSAKELHESLLIADLQADPLLSLQKFRSPRSM